MCGQEIVDGFDLAFRRCAGTGPGRVQSGRRNTSARPCRRRSVGGGSLAAHEEIGIEALLKGDDADLEIFADEQGERTLGGGGSGSVGIEIDDNFFAEAGEQAGLRLGEGGAAGGDDVVVSGVEDGDAIHLAFDEDDVVEAADGFFGEVKIEQHARLAVDGRLGRVEILGAGFVVGGEGAPGEGDDLAGFIADGEDDAVAEFAVERAARVLAGSSFAAGTRQQMPLRPRALAPSN